MFVRVLFGLSAEFFPNFPEDRLEIGISLGLKFNRIPQNFKIKKALASAFFSSGNKIRLS
jgi:hypothetical protein